MFSCTFWQKLGTDKKGAYTCLYLTVHDAGRAARAQSRGCFRAEIVPVTTTVLDDKGNKKTITVSQDEGVRPSTTMEGLAKLKPAFKDGGSTTAGEHGPGTGLMEVTSPLGKVMVEGWLSSAQSEASSSHPSSPRKLQSGE